MNLTSVSGQLNMADIKKWLHNTLVFFAPVALIYIGFVITNVSSDGISWSDFIPNNATIGAFVLYILNVALDFFKKLIADNSAK